MHVFKVIVYFWLVVFSTLQVRCDEQNITNLSHTGYGYEMLSAKLEYLQYKLIEMEFVNKEDRESVDQKLSHQETLLQGLLWAVNQLTQTVAHNLTALQTQSNKLIAQQTACASHEQMRKDIQLVALKEELMFSAGPHGRKIRSCKNDPSMRSGKYLIQPTKTLEPFVGYCDQMNDGGGWLVIQHRYNGMLNFRRNWTEYRNGFGCIDEEYWLGLERMYQMTSARPYELLVELKDFSGIYLYARYSEFEIGNETEKYALKKLGSYTGTAGDSLTYHKGMKFSTAEQDNDAIADTNCAATYEGAWWYKSCHNSNLNGPYKNAADDPKAMSWFHYKSAHTGMAYSRMLIREI